MKKETVLRVLLILSGVLCLVRGAYAFIDAWFLLKRFTLFVGGGPYLLIWIALVSFALAWIIGRLWNREPPRDEAPPQSGSDPE